MSINVDENAGWRTGYIIVDQSGQVLTGASGPQGLEWTNMAMMEELGREALVFSNPYKIPARIASKLTAEDQIFSVHLERNVKKASPNDVMMSNFIGPYMCMQRPSSFTLKQEEDLWARADRIR